MIKIKGYEFKEIKVKDSYDRRALKYKNNIIEYLRNFGLTEDDIEIKLERNAFKKAQATASWWMWDDHLFFSYNGSEKYVENLGMIAQVIKHFIYLFADEKISKEEFRNLFSEDKDILKQRIEARKTLEVEEDCMDFEKIHQNYKKLSKKYHPDMPNGDKEMFQKINIAHKILRKELQQN